MKLISDEAVAATDGPDVPADGFDPMALADPEAGPALRAFLVLTCRPLLFTRRGWTPEEVFWSRYYWFRRFVRLRVARTGPDAGLEQQAFALLECPEPDCSPDWSHLAWVEALAERDAADRLAPPPPWPTAADPGTHPIAEADVHRLAKLAGVTDYQEWKRHIEAESRIPELVSGDVRSAWVACLPIWLEQGRVRDLSPNLRVPKYWPSFAKVLGDAFVEQFWRDYPFLLELVGRLPFDSVEYLCAYDLLEGVVHQFASRGLPIPEAIFAAKGPLPPVIRRELPWDERQLDDVGRSLSRLYAEEYAPEGEA